jgi:myo-inositol catabolism protein IolC
VTATEPTTWSPTHDDPLFILAMDHRGSFGQSLFGVKDDKPTPEQHDHMVAAKDVIYRGLRQAQPQLALGRAGVLVDEQYGQAVIDAALDGAGAPDAIVLAVPIEASGHDWFTLQWPDDWLAHVQQIGPAYAKVLIRDNPDFPDDQRRAQLDLLARCSAALHEAGVPLLYELLVPATESQLASVGGSAELYDSDLRPGLVARVIADNQSAGIEARLWKVEGLETVEAARLVAAQARAGGRQTDLIVLGRDAPTERLNHWLAVAAQVPAFVGFAIGRSIWEDAIADWVRDGDDNAAVAAISASYLGFTRGWVEVTI